MNTNTGEVSRNIHKVAFRTDVCENQALISGIECVCSDWDYLRRRKFRHEYWIRSTEWTESFREVGVWIRSHLIRESWIHRSLGWRISKVFV